MRQLFLVVVTLQHLDDRVINSLDQDILISYHLNSFMNQRFKVGQDVLVNTKEIS